LFSVAEADTNDAKQRILVAGESLFAEFGLQGVTLRQITAQAGVNLAAVNYHYYDKEALCREILTRRIRLINLLRLETLRELESRSPDRPAPLPEVMAAMARPLLLCDSDPAGYNPNSRRLLGRIFTEPLPFAGELMAAEMQPTLTRFGQAIRRHLPGLSPRDFVWRYSYVVGALHHTMATLHDMKARTNGVCRNDDSEGALENFITFAVQAFTR
jgi:AcrR family transcriptional regulator